MEETLGARTAVKTLTTDVGSVAIADIVTLSEASRLLGVHIETLRDWGDAGKVTCVRVGGKRHFLLPEIRDLAQQRAHARR